MSRVQVQVQVQGAGKERCTRMLVQVPRTTCDMTHPQRGMHGDVYVRPQDGHSVQFETKYLFHTDNGTMQLEFFRRNNTF